MNLLNGSQSKALHRLFFATPFAVAFAAVALFGVPMRFVIAIPAFGALLTMEVNATETESDILAPLNDLQDRSVLIAQTFDTASD